MVSRQNQVYPDWYFKIVYLTFIYIYIWPTFWGKRTTLIVQNFYHLCSWFCSFPVFSFKNPLPANWKFWTVHFLIFCLLCKNDKFIQSIVALIYRYCTRVTKLEIADFRISWGLTLSLYILYMFKFWYLTLVSASINSSLKIL